MTPFAIAGVQMHLHHGDNLEAMRHRLQVMMHLYPWVQMAVFSELCVFGRACSAPSGYRDRPRFLRAMAREFDLWLVPGSLYESRDGRIYNTTPVIDPNGEVVARYRKMFPFAPLEEDRTGRRVLRLRGAGRRQVRRAQLLRPVVSRDGAHCERRWGRR